MSIFIIKVKILIKKVNLFHFLNLNKFQIIQILQIKKSFLKFVNHPLIRQYFQEISEGQNYLIKNDTEAVQLLRDSFCVLDRVNKKVDKNQFLKSVLENPFIKNIKEIELEDYNTKQIKKINLDELLNNIKNLIESKIDWIDIISSPVTNFKRRDMIKKFLKTQINFDFEYSPQIDVTQTLQQLENKWQTKNKENINLQEFDQYEFKIDNIETDMNNYQQQINNAQTLTLSKGPSFLEREKKLTIREQKKQNYLNDIKQQEDNMLNFKFKAKKVPPTSNNYDYFSTVTKFKRTMEQQEYKFSKNLYDQQIDKYKEKLQQKPEIDKELQNKFKPKPVPSFYNNLKNYDQIKKEEEIQRKQKIEKRKQELNQQSKLPDRMAQGQIHQEEIKKKIENLREKQFKEIHSFQPKIKHKIPDYGNVPIQMKIPIKKEQNNLKKKKKKTKQKNIFELQIQQGDNCGIQLQNEKIENNIQEQPKMTKKMQNEIELKKKQLEEKKKKEIEQKKAIKENKLKEIQNAEKIRAQLFNGENQQERKKQPFLMDFTKYYSKTICYYLKQTCIKYPIFQKEVQNFQKRKVLFKEQESLISNLTNKNDDINSVVEIINQFYFQNSNLNFLLKINFQILILFPN